MSRQKAAGARGATAQPAIKRYVGGGACYRGFPRILALGIPLNRAYESLVAGNTPSRNSMLSTRYKPDR